MMNDREYVKCRESLVRVYKLAFTTSKTRFVIINFFTIIVGLVPVAYLYISELFLQSMYNILVDGTKSNYPLIICAIYLVVAVINSILTFYIAKNIVRISYLVERQLENELINFSNKIELINFENREFHDSYQNATNGIQRVSKLLLILPSMLTQIIAAISILVFISKTSIVFSVIFFVGTIPLMLLDAKYGRKRWQLNKEQALENRQEEYYEKILTTDEYGKELRLFSLQNFFYLKWEKLYDKLFNQRMKLVEKKLFTGILGQLNTPITILLMLVFLVKKAGEGVLKVVDINVYVNASQSFAIIIYQLFGTITDTYENLLYMNDYFTFVDKISGGEYEHDSNKIVYTGKNDASLITLKNVSFKYDNSDSYTLKDINLSVNEGEVIAIVGCNGSGKTTLSKILLGIFNPNEGSVTVNNNYICDIKHESAYIMQDFVKYNFSVKENIALGNIKEIENEKKIYDIAVEAQCDEFVDKFKDNYDTILGKGYDDNGIDLSGGQWQRIGIARGLFANSKLIVLDEPTASLDPKTEAGLYKQIKELTHNHTMIMISHRLGSTKLVDRIIVLDEGRIVEMGTHENLMKENGLYASMYNKQAKWYD